MSKLQHALSIAAMGFAVFPLEANGKRPAIDAWRKKASADAKQIRRWWCDPVTGWERNHNIGVTGGTFLDVDRKHGVDGGDALADLLKNHGDLPATIRVQTPSGGEHFYFKGDPNIRNSAGRLGPGLDIRGVGGYVVGPGSTIDGKAYRQSGQHAAAAPCPAWLATLARSAPRVPRPDNKRHRIASGITLDAEATKARAIHYLHHDAPTAIQGSGGDETSFRVAARVKDFGISEALCLELMLEHWNERCTPPWSPDDLATKVGNAYRYGMEAVGAISPEADFGQTTTQPDQPSPLEPNPISPFDAAELPRRSWVLGTMLLKQQVTVMVAPPSAGKSGGGGHRYGEAGAYRAQGSSTAAGLDLQQRGRFSGDEAPVGGGSDPLSDRLGCPGDRWRGRTFSQ